MRIAKVGIVHVSGMRIPDVPNLQIQYTCTVKASVFGTLNSAITYLPTVPTSTQEKGAILPYVPILQKSVCSNV